MGRAGVLQEVRVMRFDEVLGRFRKGRLSCEEAADVLGMSVSSFYRWRQRHEAEGAEGLADRRLGRASGRRAPVDEVSAVLEHPPMRHICIAREEYAHWEGESRSGRLGRTGDYVADSVLPVVEAGRARLVESDHRLDDAIALEPIPGHTPGQVAVRIRSAGCEAVLAADLMHHPIQLALPDWSTNFCTDQDQARRTRRGFLDRVADRDVMVVPAHFPSPSAGHVIRTAADSFGFRFLGE